MASQQPAVVDSNNTTKGQYYVFKPNKQLAEGPDSNRRDALSQFNTTAGPATWGSSQVVARSASTRGRIAAGIVFAIALIDSA